MFVLFLPPAVATVFDNGLLSGVSTLLCPLPRQLELVRKVVCRGVSDLVADFWLSLLLTDTMGQSRNEQVRPCVSVRADWIGP